MLSLRLLTAVVLVVMALVPDAEGQTNFVASAGGSTSGVAHSQVVENGVVKGECAYIDNEGRHIKIRYSGDSITETEPADLANAADHLLTCRETAERLAASVAQNSRKIAGDIQRQQQTIHDNIMEQQRFLHQQLQGQQELFQEQQRQIFENLPRFGSNFPFGGLFQNPGPNVQVPFRR